MSSLSQTAPDERTARMMLSMLVEPEDAVTAGLLASFGGIETLRLSESDRAVTGLSAVETRVWREHFAHSGLGPLQEQLAQAQRMGLDVVIPGDDDWPVALDDLGDRAPYMLWTRGATSLLTRPTNDLYW